VGTRLGAARWAAWQAAQVEVEQQREAEEIAKRDLPGSVVERMVEETEINRSQA
jgi:hypothetical protein